MRKFLGSIVLIFTICALILSSVEPVLADSKKKASKKEESTICFNQKKVKQNLDAEAAGRYAVCIQYVNGGAAETLTAKVGGKKTTVTLTPMLNADTP
nr:hypothetical protein [Acetatifactor sp.]